MDQLKCASLSHTHCWYEVGMLKVYYVQYRRQYGRGGGSSYSRREHAFTRPIARQASLLCDGLLCSALQYIHSLYSIIEL